MKIKIKYKDKDIKHIGRIRNGDWIDLRAAEDIYIPKDTFALIPLGVAMEIPFGYEAQIVPRSSTFKNFHIIQTNSVGIIDNSYCGDDDWWFFPAYSLQDSTIKKNDRICQFRIVKNQPKIIFEEVSELANENRGGHGSTGIK